MSEGGKLPVALFNGTVATSNGTYHIEDITIEEAKQLIEEYNWISAIGHQAVADVMSDLFNVNVEMNRIQFQQQIGQKAIALKLKVRAPEGTVLGRDEMDQIGYSLKLMTRID